MTQVTNDYALRWEGKLYQSDRRMFGPACAEPRCASNNAWMERSACVSRPNT